MRSSRIVSWLKTGNTGSECWGRVAWGQLDMCLEPWESQHCSAVITAQRELLLKQAEVQMTRINPKEVKKKAKDDTTRPCIQ